MINPVLPRSHALRGNALLDALRPVFDLPYFLVLQVIRGAARLDCIPTQRVGTRKLGTYGAWMY